MRLDLPPLDGALCAETDPEVWFPEKGGSTKAAKAICRSCDVRAACLEFALQTGERYGIWGGQSERNRRITARERGIIATPILTPDEVTARRARVAAYSAAGATPSEISVRLKTPKHTIHNDLALIRAEADDAPPDAA